MVSSVDHVLAASGQQMAASSADSVALPVIDVHGLNAWHH